MQRLLLLQYFFNTIFIAGFINTTHNLSLIGKQMKSTLEVSHSQAYSITPLSSFNFVEFATGKVPCCCSPRVGRLTSPLLCHFV